MSKAIDWNKWWKDHLEQYLSAIPRAGIFIRSQFPLIRTSLEVACGSSRDSLYLARRGVHATATDYEEGLISDLKNRFILPTLSYVQADAFQLPFRNETFDIVFHNGFFVLLDNAAIEKVLKEEFRVSRRYILFFEHNRWNPGLVRQFSLLAVNDSVYDIRFFDPNEICSIVKDVGLGFRCLEIFKFGGLFDCLFSKRIKRYLPNILYPFRNHIIPRLYQWQRWEQTERVACLIKK